MYLCTIQYMYTDAHALFALFLPCKKPDANYK